jgi:hypothetical protein
MPGRPTDVFWMQAQPLKSCWTSLEFTFAFTFRPHILFTVRWQWCNGCSYRRLKFRCLVRVALIRRLR